jgi:hypothetical protein
MKSRLQFRPSFLLYDRLYGLMLTVPGYRSRGPGFDYRRYKIFWEVVGLKRGPLSVVRIIEELLERKVAASVYRTEINVRGDSLRWPRDTLYLLKLARTSPTSGGRSVGIVRWRTKAPDFFFCCSMENNLYSKGKVVQVTEKFRVSAYWILSWVTWI